MNSPQDGLPFDPTWCGDVVPQEPDGQFRRVFDATTDGLLQIDGEGRILLANRAIQQMFGFRSEELLGRPVEMLMPPQHRAGHVALRAGYLKSPQARAMAQRAKLFARRKDGSDFPVEIGLTPMTTPSGDGVLATVSDVSVRERARVELETALAEKTALLKEVHHRVKNNLQVISSLLSLQSGNAPAEVQAALLVSQHRVGAMALIHQLLYERSDFSTVSLGPYLFRLCDLLRAGYLGERDDIRIVVDESPEAVVLDLSRAIPCGLLANELVTNAIKHAFPEGRSGTIEIGIARCPGQTGEISVRDDGVGLPVGLLPGQTSSLGFNLISALADQIGASVTIESHNGTCFRFRFPTTQEDEAS